MAQHTNVNPSPADSRRLEGLAWPLFAGLLGVGVAALALSFLLALVFDEHGIKRFGFAYLVGFAFTLSLGVGSLFFVMVTHLFRAGWVVVLRRVPETLAASLPFLALLSLPILVYTAANNGVLYPWAQEFGHHGGDGGHEGPDHGGEAHDAEHAAPAAGDAHSAAPNAHGYTATIHTVADPAHPPLHSEDAHQPPVAHTDSDTLLHGSMSADEASHDVMSGIDHHSLEYAVHEKQPWFSVPFWIARVILYLAIFSLLGLWYWRTSTRQDLTGDAGLTRKMEIFAAPGLILFGAALTFTAFDLLMSLDPTWFSTMFGIYYFAGTFQCTMAATILILMFLQSRGFLPSVTREHYHDLGKLMFAFVVFYAYIFFSQYMLIWYARIPAEEPWLIIRGLSTNDGHDTEYHLFPLLLLFGRFVIPFLGLMSRHVKRRKATLAFWSAWLIVMHMVDMFWVVMPQYSAEVMPRQVPLPIVELLAIVGIASLFLAYAVRVAARNSLMPVGDPRLNESLALVNI